MFAISFDMVIVDLKEYFGEPYTNAYYEIGRILRNFGFYNVQGSLYLSQSNDMANLFRAMGALKETVWFKKSVRDIRASGSRTGLILQASCKTLVSSGVGC